MTEKLITLTMTTTEYHKYRNCQKELNTLKKSLDLKEKALQDERDRYVSEFEERQNWSKRAIKAEKTLDKLLDVVHSSMSAKVRLEALTFEIEDFYKDRNYKHD